MIYEFKNVTSENCISLIQFYAKYGDRSFNRVFTFGHNGIYNRRHAEFDNAILVNLLKGFLQKFKINKLY